MKLTGSRARGEADRYSDWDYAVEEAADFDWIDSQIARAACYRVYQRGTLWVLTILMPDLQMIDCSGAGPEFTPQWSELEQAQTHIPLSDYWIFAVKHLKGINRGYTLLADVGLEYSIQILRDLYVEQRLGVKNYKDFFSYKAGVLPRQAELGELFEVTGLPTRTLPERIDKLMAMNALICTLSPDFSLGLHERVRAELLWLKESGV